MSDNSEKKPVILSSEYLFRRPWLTVRRDSLRYAGGKANPEYYVLEYPDWINVIAITRDGQFIFVRQYRHGLGKYAYELCAGVIEDSDASPMEAAKRELLEETGYGKGQWSEWMALSANPGSQNNLTHCFLATDLELVAVQHLDDTEELTVHLFSLAEVREMLEKGEIVQALHAAPLWKYMSGREHPTVK